MVNQIVYNIVLCLTCMSHWPPVSDQTEPQCVWMTCLSEPWYLLGGRSVAWVCNRRALTYKTYLNSIPTCHWAHICRTPAHCDTTWHCTGCPPPCQTWVICHMSQYWGHSYHTAPALQTGLLPHQLMTRHLQRHQLQTDSQPGHKV